MTYKKIYLYPNPEFDKRCKNGISRLYHKFCIENDYCLEIINQKFLQHNSPKEKYSQTLLIAGGDGTVHQAINTIPEDNLDKYIFGIIPGGTANELAKALSIPLSIEQAADLVITPKKINYQPIGTINQKIKFLTGLLFGISHHVLKITPKKAKHILGPKAFSMGIIKYLISSITTSKETYKEFKINKIHCNTNYLLINNLSLCSKDIKKNEIANEDRLKFSLIFLNSNLSFIDFIRLFTKNQFHKNLLQDKSLNYSQCNKALFEFNGECEFLLDGEEYLLPSPFKIEHHQTPIAFICF